MRRVALLAVLFLTCLGGCGGPPQIGKDEQAFKAVDALYTAVSLRDPNLLDRCDRHLGGLRKNGKLSEAAGETLVAIIAEARQQSWESAQVRLGDFMRGQRR